jgi:hypothetical protein
MCHPRSFRALGDVREKAPVTSPDDGGLLPGGSHNTSGAFPRCYGTDQKPSGGHPWQLDGVPDCAMLAFTNDAFRRSIQDETGSTPEWALEACTDLGEDARQSIAKIKASAFIPHKDAIRGFVFDVATGKLNEAI